MCVSKKVVGVMRGCTAYGNKDFRTCGEGRREGGRLVHVIEGVVVRGLRERV